METQKKTPLPVAAGQEGKKELSKISVAERSRKCKTY